MKVTVEGKTIAEATKDQLIYIEGSWYFPPDSINKEYFENSPTPYTCPWKGVCQYFNIIIDGKKFEDVAWTYPDPYPGAFQRVKKDFSNYVAFWRDAVVAE